MSGTVFFTFDDCDLEGWTNAIELFRKHNAHATFFFYGEVTGAYIECMKKLAAAGHSVGLHSRTHANAPEFIQKNGADAYWKQEIEPQLSAVKAAGLDIRNFAFPNNLYDDAVLALLGKQFKRFRAGCGASLEEPETEAYEKAFHDPAELPDRVIFGGFGVGMYYHTKLESFLNALEKAAEEDKVAVFYSHSIVPNAPHVHMPLEYLTAALEKAEALGMKILGFNDVEK